MSLMTRFFRRGMTCSQVAAVLQQYLDSELDPAQIPKVLAHLEACRECGLEADVYRRIKESLVQQRQAPDDESLDRLRAMAQELAATGELPD